MRNEYESTIQFWDEIFSDNNATSPTKPIDNLALEKSVEWISKGSDKLIDFGCGSGRVLLRSLNYGVNQVYGVDISDAAIACAKKSVEEYGISEKAKFKTGGVGLLKECESQSYDGAILYNIIDNLLPKDAMIVLKEIHRIVKESGKILIKFNPYIESELRKEYNFQEIEEEFYKETSGLYLWNLTDQRIKEILQPHFRIEEEIIVEFPEHNQINRMYYLRNKGQ